MGDIVKYHAHNASVLKSLHPGDLIEFPRGPYSHWAVYLGDEMVAHLAGEYDDGLDSDFKPEYTFTICGVKFDKAKVCKDNFWKVVGNSIARKNNGKDSKMRPLSTAQIIKNATMKIGEVGYNIITSNCEHFAKWCRYGVEKSDQVESFFTGVALGAAAIAAVGAIYALSKYSTKAEEEEEESDQEDDW